MADEQAPYQDPATPILSQSTDIDDEKRADLFDIFHNSKDHNELARKLQPVAAPDQLKSQLFEAKKKFTVTDPAERAAASIERLAQIKPEILDLAENHPNVMKAFMATATKGEEKASGEPAQAGGKQPGGKSQGTGKAAPVVVPDVPPTPSGHALVKTRDHAIHHIPVENIDKARAIDPELQVLHVEP
jgi:hypothetical protein